MQESPATEPSCVAELMGELFCAEFGHRVKIDSLDVTCSFEVLLSGRTFKLLLEVPLPDWLKMREGDRSRCLSPTKSSDRPARTSSQFLLTSSCGCYGKVLPNPGGVVR